MLLSALPICWRMEGWAEAERPLTTSLIMLPCMQAQQAIAQQVGLSQHSSSTAQHEHEPTARPILTAAVHIVKLADFSAIHAAHTYIPLCTAA